MKRKEINVIHATIHTNDVTSCNHPEKKL